MDGATHGGEHMQIGRAADLTGLSIRTLRHYEEVGLVAPSARSAGGFRLYTRGDVERLLVVRRMKPLGFTLDEMRQLLGALDDLADPVADHGAAARVLGEFHARAARAVEQLRTQLAYAEEFAGLLRDRTRPG